jgi:putative peptidoglycan lipid II flippase
MSPFLVLVSLAALFMGVLNSLRVFFYPSIAPAFFNLMMIGSIIYFPPLFIKQGAHPILSLGVGVILGGLSQMLIQLPLVIKKGYAPMGPIRPFSRKTSKIIKRVGIGTLGIAATQINILVTTILATGTVVGAVSWLSYGFRLFQFPVGVFGVSLAGSNLVYFSDCWKRGDQLKAIETFSRSYLFCLIILVPITALSLNLALPSVHLIFERGMFTFSDSQMTALALKYYILGLPFYGLYKIFVPIFYTLDRPKIPVVISVVCVFLNIIFCLLLVPHFGFKILAVGTSVSMIINCFLQGLYLKKFLALKSNFFFNLRILKVLLASLGVYVLCGYLVEEVFDFHHSFVMKALTFILIVAMSLAVYFVLLYGLGERTELLKKK